MSNDKAIPLNPRGAATHNESRAEFNGTGATVDAEISVNKDQIKERAIIYAVGVVTGLIVDRAVLPLFRKGTVEAAKSVVEHVE